MRRPSTASFSTAQTPRPPKPEHAREYALVDAVCAQEGLQTCYGAPTPDDVLDVLRLDGYPAWSQVHLNEGDRAAPRLGAGRAGAAVRLGRGRGRVVQRSGVPQHLLLSGRWRRLAAEYRDQDAWAPRFLAGIVLPLLHPALPSTLHRLRAGEGMYRRWLIDPAFARRAKPLATSLGRAVGGAAHAIAASASRASERAHRGVGGERRAAGHRVSLPAAGPAAAGVRPGAAARTVPARDAGAAGCFATDCGRCSRRRSAGAGARTMRLATRR